jgi:hypothetical protein
MKARTLLLVAALFVSRVVLGQHTEPVAANGYFVIQDKVAFKKGDSVFCNPATMPDRIILDSSKKMIAKKVSNPMGYTYYEWRNKEHTRTYEEINIPGLKLKQVIYFTDSGSIRPVEKNSVRSCWTYYFRAMPNPQQRYNGLWIAEKVRVELTKPETDSILDVHKYLKGKVMRGTEFWTELNFYENGKLASTGTVITGLKEGNAESTQKTPENEFRVGQWTYYEVNGQLNQKEIITTIRKVRK